MYTHLYSKKMNFMSSSPIHRHNAFRTHYNDYYEYVKSGKPGKMYPDLVKMVIFLSENLMKRHWRKNVFFTKIR